MLTLQLQTNLYFKPAVQHIFLPSYYSGIHSNFKFLGDNDSVLFFVNVCT